MKNIIYLAGGCFWGLQKFFDQFDGVLEAEYAVVNDSVYYSSAAVTLDQKELYTYNNTDTFHISETTENSGVTEITAAVWDGNSVNVQIFCSENTIAAAYCAFYDENGKMLDVAIRDLTAGEDNDLTV